MTQPQEASRCPAATPPAALTKADKKLITREADRLVDIVMGRAGTQPVICHYLIVERESRLSFGADWVREIEQYRDLERVVSVAADCETGDRTNCRWRGAFTATYRDGLLVGMKIVKHMDKRVAAERAKRPCNRLSPGLKHDNMLKPSAEELATRLEDASSTGLRNFGRASL